MVLNVCEKLVEQQITKEQVKQRSRVGEVAWEDEMWLKVEKKDRERGSESQLSCVSLAEQWLEMRKLGKEADMLRKEVDMLKKEKSKMEDKQAMKVDNHLLSSSSNNMYLMWTVVRRCSPSQPTSLTPPTMAGRLPQSFLH